VPERDLFFLAAHAGVRVYIASHGWLGRSLVSARGMGKERLRFSLMREDAGYKYWLFQVGTNYCGLRHQTFLRLADSCGKHSTVFDTSFLDWFLLRIQSVSAFYLFFGSCRHIVPRALVRYNVSKIALDVSDAGLIIGFRSSL
jgi:hypothetical protein